MKNTIDKLLNLEIPSALDVLKKHEYLVRVETDGSNMENPSERAMIEFARMHVNAALEKASKCSRINLFVRRNRKGSRYKLVKHGESYDLIGTRQMWKIDKESIKNSYPLSNIV